MLLCASGSTGNAVFVKLGSGSLLQSIFGGLVGRLAVLLENARVASEGLLGTGLQNL